MQGRYEGELVQDYYDECLKYLAILARKFLRKRVDDSKNQIDHKLVTAAIDMGIWHDEYQVVNPKQTTTPTLFNMMSDVSSTANFGPFKDQYTNDERAIKCLLISSIYESNYTNFLDLEFLQSRYQTLNYLEDSASGDL